MLEDASLVTKLIVSRLFPVEPGPKIPEIWKGPWIFAPQDPKGPLAKVAAEDANEELLGCTKFDEGLGGSSSGSRIGVTGMEETL